MRHECHFTAEYRGAAHSTCNSKYSVRKRIPIAFHSRSNYDYHFIVKALAEEFEWKFNCLGENNEKYLTFLVPLENKVKNGEEILSDYNLWTVQDLWKAYYQTMLIIFHEINCTNYN